MLAAEKENDQMCIRDRGIGVAVRFGTAAQQFSVVIAGRVIARPFAWHGFRLLSASGQHGPCLLYTSYGDLIEIVGTAPLQRDQLFYGRKVDVQDIPIQSLSLIHI